MFIRNHFMPIFYPQHNLDTLKKSIKLAHSSCTSLTTISSLQTTPFLFQNITIKYYECMTLPWPFEPSNVSLKQFAFSSYFCWQKLTAWLAYGGCSSLLLAIFCFSVTVFCKYLIHMPGFNRLISNLLHCTNFNLKCSWPSLLLLYPKSYEGKALFITSFLLWSENFGNPLKTAKVPLPIERF